MISDPPPCNYAPSWITRRGRLVEQPDPGPGVSLPIHLDNPPHIFACFRRRRRPVVTLDYPYVVSRPARGCCPSWYMHGMRRRLPLWIAVYLRVPRRRLARRRPTLETRLLVNHVFCFPLPPMFSSRPALERLTWRFLTSSPRPSMLPLLKRSELTVGGRCSPGTSIRDDRTWLAQLGSLPGWRSRGRGTSLRRIRRPSPPMAQTATGSCDSRGPNPYFPQGSSCLLMLPWDTLSRINPSESQS